MGTLHASCTSCRSHCCPCWTGSSAVDWTSCSSSAEDTWMWIAGSSCMRTGGRAWASGRWPACPAHGWPPPSRGAELRTWARNSRSGARPEELPAAVAAAPAAPSSPVPDSISASRTPRCSGRARKTPTARPARCGTIVALHWHCFTLGPAHIGAAPKAGVRTRRQCRQGRLGRTCCFHTEHAWQGAHAEAAQHDPDKGQHVAGVCHLQVGHDELVRRGVCYASAPGSTRHASNHRPCTGEAQVRPEPHLDSHKHIRQQRQQLLQGCQQSGHVGWRAVGLGAYARCLGWAALLGAWGWPCAQEHVPVAARRAGSARRTTSCTTT